LADERGYRTLTVTDIVQAAGVSKRTFYESFDNKDDCFLTTYDLIVRHAAREVLASQRHDDYWRKKLRAAFTAFAQEVAAQPRAARLALVEAFAAGPSALAHMRHTGGLFVTLLEESFARADDRVELSPLIVTGMVAGIAAVARARLLAGREAHLLREADSLMEWTLSLRSESVADLSPSTSVAAPPAPSSDWWLDIQRRLPREERALIVSAAAAQAATDGYRQLSVRRICRAAGLSRRCFEAHFEGLADCFSAVLEQSAGDAIAIAAQAYESAPDWPAGIHRAIVALCTYYAANPAIARLSFVEIFSAGSEGVQCRARLTANAAALFRGHAPTAVRTSRVAAEASVGGVWAIFYRYIAGGQAHRLPQGAATCSFLALAPTIGARTAAAVIRTELAPRRHPGVASWLTSTSFPNPVHDAGKPSLESPQRGRT
jgi:AcrR family transcriptional regulator